jgi:LVIVD repeat
MSLRKTIALSAVAGLLVAGIASSATARPPVKGEGENMKPIVNIPWTGGTDMEIVTIKGRDYAFASSTAPSADGGGLHVIDVTVPEKSKEVGYVPCSINQGDVQISWNQRYVYVGGSVSGDASCGIPGGNGFVIYDIKNPAKPKAVGFADTGTSHNVTAHPSKPYVYNSNSALAGNPEIQIWDVKNPAKPVLVNEVPSVPHATHDIAFSSNGKMAVTAAISHWDIFDTSDPENPTLLWTGQCPGCSITHDAKFLPDDSGIVIGDEAGGGLTFPCPGGALYFYQLQGTDAQPVPVLTGVFEPHTVIFPQGTTPGSCTSHVFEINDQGTHLAIAWYASGVHYINMGDLTGVAVGSQSAGNVKREAWFIPSGGSTWSAKLHEGPYMFTNDIHLGFIAYKLSAPK